MSCVRVTGVTGGVKSVFGVFRNTSSALGGKVVCINSSLKSHRNTSLAPIGDVPTECHGVVVIVSSSIMIDNIDECYLH